MAAERSLAEKHGEVGAERMSLFLWVLSSLRRNQLFVGYFVFGSAVTA
jgi:hypothetical protein